MTDFSFCMVDWVVLIFREENIHVFQLSNKFLRIRYLYQTKHTNLTHKLTEKDNILANLSLYLFHLVDNGFIDDFHFYIKQIREHNSTVLITEHAGEVEQ